MLDKVEFYAKKANYLFGIFLIIAAFVFLLTGSLINVINWFFPVYLAFFGLLLISGEINFGWINNYFGFLKNYFGRGLFDIYCGALCINYAKGNPTSISEWIGMIGAILMTAVGVICIIIGFVKACKPGSSNGLLDTSKAAVPQFTSFREDERLKKVENYQGYRN